MRRLAFCCLTFPLVVITDCTESSSLEATLVTALAAVPVVGVGQVAQCSLHVVAGKVVAIIDNQTLRAIARVQTVLLSCVQRIAAVGAGTAAGGQAGRGERPSPGVGGADTDCSRLPGANGRSAGGGIYGDPQRIVSGRALIYEAGLLQRGLRLGRVEVREDASHAAVFEHHAVGRRGEHKQFAEQC